MDRNEENGSLVATYGMAAATWRYGEAEEDEIKWGGDVETWSHGNAEGRRHF